MSLLLLFNGGVIGPVNADLAVTEANDTLIVSAALDTAGGLGVTEAHDVPSAAGALAVGGSAFINEADDGVGATATVLIAAVADMGEAGDVPASAGAIAVTAVLAVVEADDTVSTAAALGLVAAMILAEEGDFLASFTQMPIFYPRRGGLDAGEERERRQREWREDLRRIIDRSLRIARGEIDPVTFEPIPPPDYSPVIFALIDEARALDRSRAETFVAELRLAQEEEAIALLLLAA
jgi:hypothetical protein